MSSRSFAVDPQIEDYVDSVNPAETDALARLRAETQAMPNAQMQIGASQGQFLAMLAKLMGAKRYLEIGVFTGYSSLLMAGALPEDGKIIALDVSEEYTSVAKRHWKGAGLDHKIDLRIGPALDSLDRMIASGEENTFDIAFIDADKVNNNAYLERCLKLVRPNGLILIDNVLRGGKVLDPAADDAETTAVTVMNPTLKNDPRIEVLMLPLFDGLTMIRRR